MSGDLAVGSGQTLYVNVGGIPTGVSNCDSNVACNGGFNGGESSSSGGGGGASDVRTVSRSQSGSLTSRLIVAAGGGGSGSRSRECILWEPARTNPPSLVGSAAMRDGTATLARGPGTCFADEGTGGGAGTQTAGGDGGLSNGESGALRQGGGAVLGGAGGGALVRRRGRNMESGRPEIRLGGGGAAAPTWCQ